MKTPWHLWVVGIVTLLWNSGGAYDYVMTQTRNETYLEALTPEQMAYFDNFPAWTEFFWALGVWGALLGSILLLLRSRYAVWAFAGSVVGIAVNLVYGLLISDTPMTELMGPGAAWFSAAIVVVAVLLLWYARAMKMRGVLS